MLADLAAKAEDLGPDDSLEDHEAAYNALKEAVTRVVQCIDEYLQESDAA